MHDSLDPRIVEAVINEVRRPSQTQTSVAARLGVSVTMISQVCSGKYESESPKLEKAVRALLLGDKTECPVLGEIPFGDCMSQQQLPLVATSPQRIQIFKACHGGCINYRGRNV